MSRGQVPGTRKKNVLYIVWPEPLIVAGPGTAIDDAITLLGDVNIAQGTATAYPKYSIEEVIRQAPDVILIGKGSGMDMVAVSRGHPQEDDVRARGQVRRHLLPRRRPVPARAAGRAGDRGAC